MVLSFSDIHHKITTKYGIEFKPCPIGAHYVNGKVEQKIQQIKKSLLITLGKSRLSVLQWETVCQQISNSINNLPIGLGNKVESLENMDILTPNWLILGRNNNRNPNLTLVISCDLRKIIDTNNKIFRIWFQEWLISYVPSLIQKPKWCESDRNICVGDIILFLKSEKELDKQYQYGIVVMTYLGKDDRIRTVDVEYQNHNENVKHKRNGMFGN